MGTRNGGRIVILPLIFFAGRFINIVFTLEVLTRKHNSDIMYTESEGKKMKAWQMWWVITFIGIAILIACELVGIPID